MLADQIAYVALVSSDPATATRVLGRHFGLPRAELSSAAGPVPVFALGRGALAVFPPGHPLVDGEARPGVHHIALAVDDPDAAAALFDVSAPDDAPNVRPGGTSPQGHGARVPPGGANAPSATAPTLGLGGRRIRRVAREATNGVRVLLTERLALTPRNGGPVERLDHVGVASSDVAEDEALFSGKLGFPVESRQTDIEVSVAMESFTSDKYGVVYHTRPAEPVGGLRVTFITVGDCELEFLANFDARQQGRVDHGRAGTTRQDQGAIARYVTTRGRGLHHFAVKARDADALLSGMAADGLPMIDVKGRPGSRRALIGFPHPRALGGVLMHVVQRDA
jgi:catechol 2,3-dioxygenase-like lactoylglutathione lyase family enzyme